MLDDVGVTLEVVPDDRDIADIADGAGALGALDSAQENRGLGVAVPDDPLQFGLELDFRLGDEEAGEGVDGEGEILGEGGTSSSKGRGHHRCLGRAGLFGRYSDSDRGRGRGRERMMSVRAIRSGAVIKAFFYGF